LFSEVNTAGWNPWEKSESTRRTAAVERGAVRRATAYQRAFTRHLSKRDTSWRKPTLPEAKPVTRMAATLGPRSMAIPNTAIWSIVAGMPSGPTDMRIAPHEMANVRMK
jgi:hypothetical protein